MSSVTRLASLGQPRVPVQIHGYYSRLSSKVSARGFHPTTLSNSLPLRLYSNPGADKNLLDIAVLYGELEMETLLRDTNPKKGKGVTLYTLVPAIEMDLALRSECASKSNGKS